MKGLAKESLLTKKGTTSLPVRITLAIASFAIVLSVAMVSGAIFEPKQVKPGTAAQFTSDPQPQATIPMPIIEKAEPPKAKKRIPRSPN